MTSSARAFYRDALGLPTSGVVATELVDHETGAAGAIVIFKLDGGLVLSLYPRSGLGKDAAVPAGRLRAASSASVSSSRAATTSLGNLWKATGASDTAEPS
jgi:uncharacterized protein